MHVQTLKDLHSTHLTYPTSTHHRAHSCITHHPLSLTQPSLGLDALTSTPAHTPPSPCTSTWPLTCS